MRHEGVDCRVADNLPAPEESAPERLAFVESEMHGYGAPGQLAAEIGNPETDQRPAEFDIFCDGYGKASESLAPVVPDKEYRDIGRLQLVYVQRSGVVDLAGFATLHDQAQVLFLFPLERYVERLLRKERSRYQGAVLQLDVPAPDIGILQGGTPAERNLVGVNLARYAAAVALHHYGLATDLCAFADHVRAVENAQVVRVFGGELVLAQLGVNGKRIEIGKVFSDKDGVEIGVLLCVHLVVGAVADASGSYCRAPFDPGVANQAYVGLRRKQNERRGRRDVESGACRERPRRIVVVYREVAERPVLLLRKRKLDFPVCGGVHEAIGEPGFPVALHPVEGVVYAAFEFERGLDGSVPAGCLDAFVLDHAVQGKGQ